MEALNTALDERLSAPSRKVFAGGCRKGTLVERLEHAVEQHATSYETVGHISLAVQAQHWRSGALRERYAASQRELRRNLNDWLLEISSIPREKREAVDAIASFEMWHRLRVLQGMDSAASVATVTRMLKRLILEE